MEAALRKALGVVAARAGRAQGGPGASARRSPASTSSRRTTSRRPRSAWSTRGIRRDSPDYFAVEVMNEVFGGGFSARLFSNIRSKKGLAYSVGGGVGANFDYPGLFQLSMGTKSGSTAAAIDALYEEIDNLLKTPATRRRARRAPRTPSSTPSCSASTRSRR